MFKAFILVCALFTVLIAGAQGATTAANMSVVDDDGMATPNNCNSVSLAYSTIQAAVSAAPVNTQIKVCPGTYTEQVTVSTNQIKLQSTPPLGAIIKMPSSFALPNAIVRFTGGSSGGLLKNFEVTGTFDIAGCGDVMWGVRVDDSSQAVIQGNHITEIRSTNTGLRGCQAGIGIQVGRNFETQVGTATIKSNTIDNYQKNGMTIDGPGSSATVSLNTVSGNPTDGVIIAQNGIQVSRDAVGKVNDNNVSANVYTGDDPNNDVAASTGILLFQAAGTTSVNSNDVDANDDNISLYTTIGATVKNNNSTNAVAFDGLFADSDATSNKFTSNVASGNANLDCDDLSTGTKTAGTANTWKLNTGTTSSPAGICTPPVAGPDAVDRQERVRPAPSLAQ